MCYPDENGDVPENAINIWTNPDGSELSQVLLEDTEFGSWIQKSMESDGFDGVPLSYQEARIYHWNQWADRMIGIENIPEELRVAQVMGEALARGIAILGRGEHGAGEQQQAVGKLVMGAAGIGGQVGRIDR